MADADHEPFEGEVAVRGLRRSGWMLLAAFPIMVALGRWFWGVDDGDRLLQAMGGGWAAVGGPLWLAGLDTQWRLGRDQSTRFEPQPLNTAMRLGAGGLVAFMALGVFGVLLAAPLVLTAAAFLAMAWVRPRDEDVTLTRMIGATIPILLFIGGLNIDERPVVGALLFAAGLSGLIRLYLFRQVAHAEK